MALPSSRQYHTLFLDGGLRVWGSRPAGAGSKVQLKFVFTDNGSGLYSDQMTVQVSEFIPGSGKPLLYQSEPETIQQVQLTTRGDPAEGNVALIQRSAQHLSLPSGYT